MDQDGFQSFEFRVKDEGTGIFGQDRRDVFNANFISSEQPPGQPKRKARGLGLNLCKSLAQALGGDLTLDDGYRVGCLFILSLKLRCI